MQLKRKLKVVALLNKNTGPSMKQYIPSFDGFVNESLISNIKEKISSAIQWVKSFLFTSKHIEKEAEAVEQSIDQYVNTLDSFVNKFDTQAVAEARAIPKAETDLSINYDTATVRKEYKYQELPQEFKDAIDQTIEIESELARFKRENEKILKEYARLQEQVKKKRTKLTAVTNASIDELLSKNNVDIHVEKIQAMVKGCANKQVEAAWEVFKVVQFNPNERSLALYEFQQLLENSPAADAKKWLVTLKDVLKKFNVIMSYEYINKFDTMTGV